MPKIGLFGGSFNPIHHGHLILAQEALYQFHLDKIIFIPTFIPPHKDPKELIDFHHRFQMVCQAIEGNPNFETSDIEMKRKGISYTIDTVYHFQEVFENGSKIYLIVGLDMLSEIFSWKDGEKLINLCSFLGAPRQGYSLDRLDDRVRQRVKLIQMPLIEISGRTIRDRIKSGKSARYWVSEPVYQYMVLNSLYTVSHHIKAGKSEYTNDNLR